MEKNEKNRDCWLSEGRSGGESVEGNEETEKIVVKSKLAISILKLNSKNDF